MAAAMLSPCPAGREGLPLEALVEVLLPDVVYLDLQVVIAINPYEGDVVDAHAVLPQPLVQTIGSQITIMDVDPVKMHPVFVLLI
jgi:hypothetical protein